MFLISECTRVSVYHTTGHGWRGGWSKAAYWGLRVALQCLGLGFRDHMKLFAVPGRAEVRKIGLEPYAPCSMMELWGVWVLYGYWVEGPSVMCVLKKYEICFRRQLSALFAGFHYFVGVSKFAVLYRALQVRSGLCEIWQQTLSCSCRCHTTFNTKRWQPM